MLSAGHPGLRGGTLPAHHRQAFPGNTGVRPEDITPLAEILRMNGYNTAAFGKYHETPPWEVSVKGAFDRWPTHSGFGPNVLVVHLPTSRVALEAVVRLLVAEFDVPPLRRDGRTLLRRGEERFKASRTWA